MSPLDPLTHSIAIVVTRSAGANRYNRQSRTEILSTSKVSASFDVVTLRILTVAPKVRLYPKVLPDAQTLRASLFASSEVEGTDLDAIPFYDDPTRSIVRLKARRGTFAVLARWQLRYLCAP